MYTQSSDYKSSVTEENTVKEGPFFYSTSMLANRGVRGVHEQWTARSTYEGQDVDYKQILRIWGKVTSVCEVIFYASKYT